MSGSRLQQHSGCVSAVGCLLPVIDLTSHLLLHRLQKLQGQGRDWATGRLHLCRGAQWLWQKCCGEWDRGKLKALLALNIWLDLPGIDRVWPRIERQAQPSNSTCCASNMQGEAVAFALGGNRKMLRAGSVAALLNQELAAAGHRTAEVRPSRSARQGKARQ